MQSLSRLLMDGECVLRIAGALLYALLFVGAVTRRAPDSTSPRTFLGRQCFALGLLLGLLGAVNFLVNPFGTYPTHVFEPIVSHSRADKMRLYAASRPTPEIVVFGNSRSFTLPPAYILQRTGRPAFNASVAGGVPADYLGFFRYMAAIGRVPRILIMSLSVELFLPHLTASVEPGDPLRSYREEGGDLRMATVALISLRQTQASLRLVGVELQGRPSSPRYQFDSDGFGHVNEMWRHGSVAAVIARDWAPSMFRFAELDRSQALVFEELLTLAHRHGTTVVGYVPPFHPRVTALYEETSNLPILRAQMLDLAREWKSRSMISAVHDFTEIESFGGSAAMFDDDIHPGEEASRLMLANMLIQPPGTP